MSRYIIRTTKRFEKDVERCKKRGYNLALLRQVITILEENGVLPPKYKSHKLSGNYSRYWECHIQSDWLLVWEQNDTELILLLVDTGTHADLF